MHPTISGIGCDVSSAVMNDNEDLKMINNNGAPSRPTAAESSKFPYALSFLMIYLSFDALRLYGRFIF